MPLVGQERAHAALVVQLAQQAAPGARVAARVHAVDHPAFADDMAVIAGEAGQHLCHIMVPKVEPVDDVLRAEQALLRAGAAHLPLHVLIESPAAVQQAFAIAAHLRAGAASAGFSERSSFPPTVRCIPASAMGVAGQFSYPLVARAKLEIAAACHARRQGAVGTVVTEFTDASAMHAAASRAASELGYTRHVEHPPRADPSHSCRLRARTGRGREQPRATSAPPQRPTGRPSAAPAAA